MERKQAERLRERFHAELAGKRTITLRIPDDCDFMDPELIELLRRSLAGHLDW